MLNFKITIWELNSKKQEQIIACENFDNREDAETFISSYKAESKPYKLMKKKQYFEMT